MKTKIVYTLTSDSSDYYLEQLYLSVFSLRKYNKNISVVAVIDDVTNASLDLRRKSLLSGVDNIQVVEIDKKYSKVERSRFIKTSLRRYILGDFLYIDTDTIVCEDLSEVDNWGNDVMAVSDLHVCLGRHNHRLNIYRYTKLFDIETTSEDIYYNSGVMFVRDSNVARELYDNWHKKWLYYNSKGCVYDQIPLFDANKIMGNVITELDGIWNCQVVENGLKYLKSAKIIHYFASKELVKYSKHPFLVNDLVLFDDLKKMGALSKKYMVFIDNPKSSFVDKIQLVSDDEVDLINSPYYKILRKLYFCHRKKLEMIYKFVKLIKL